MKSKNAKGLTNWSTWPIAHDLKSRWNQDLRMMCAVLNKKITQEDFAYMIDDCMRKELDKRIKDRRR